MILYQIAKSMEERARLDATIREAGGDVSQLLDQKALIEQAVLEQASRWIEVDPSAYA